jgi:hypothetical protein
METILKLLLAGYVIGLVCMSYLILRSWNFRLEGASRHKALTIIVDREVNWLGIALFSMAVSYLWCFIGGGVHFFLDSNIQFLQFSFLFAITSSLAIFAIKTTRKLDKIVINSIVVLGSGILFANMF